MKETDARSPYWLSPGIDVPTRAELGSSFRVLRGFYVEAWGAEALFVPNSDFMRQLPLWRLDVLDDLVESIAQTRQHALVDYARQCRARCPGVPMERHLQAFRQVCRTCGVAVPDDLEAVLVFDQQFAQSRS